MRFRPLIALLLCLACQRDERPAEAIQASAVADDRPVDGGTLYRRLDVDVVTLNPAVSTTRNDRLVSQYIFTPVIHLDRNLQAIPGLADSWDISDDGLTYRFHLNKKATFSDGKPVRAADLIFTLRKIVDPASEALQIAGAFEYLDLTKTRALDDHTAEIVFRQPLATQLTRFNDVLVLPEHVYSKGSFRADYNETAVGSGPYVLVRREHGNEIVLQRRKDYWGDRPHIERVVWRVINDHGVAFNALRLGQVDETILTADTWVRERNNPEVTKTIDFQRFYTLNYNYIAWNTRHPALRDKRVRRALAMC
ncbi:MAG TPA: ABC transporter substrate-binding protein, partial [Thermoanaerobaculia bacterium]|nr:ABC transporter substrate-binding protein [Thermoanaerobaculia bacterium]